MDKKDATMRCAIAEQEAWNLIDGIQGQEMIQVADEKRAEHEYREIMKTNECTGWSRIIKTIYLKNRKRLEGGKRYTAKTTSIYVWPKTFCTGNWQPLLT